MTITIVQPSMTLAAICLVLIGGSLAMVGAVIGHCLTRASCCCESDDEPEEDDDIPGEPSGPDA
jgi:hypothetical protein